ncbi:DUF6660 family protein [Epilithonimonas vandammei]|uniref:DUF6660 family protein n=2 Tax=Bacteroidota/Chlorobiota group TaxID=68336 RepID=UPI0029373027|nr:DUF6660 family protein [Epilithonimonas vandammei]
MPCTDACGMNIDNTTKSEFTRTNEGQKSSNDVCSPFCSCTCCHTIVNFTFQSFKINETKPSFGKQQKFPLWAFNFISNYHGNIWQPPKINA